MSLYLPPKLKDNGKLNELFNSRDFDYQFDPLSFNSGDKRYTNITDFTAQNYATDVSLNLLDEDISALETKLTNISYNGSVNKTTIQDVNAGTITQDDGKRINQTSGSSTLYNYLQSTNITNLVVTDSLKIPSGTTISGITYNGDIVITNPAKILQSVSGINQLNSTDFTGNVSVSGTLQGLSTTIYGYLSGLSQNLNTALLNLQTKTVNQTYLSGSNTTAFSGNVSVSGTLQGLSPTIYGYLSTSSSNIQNQVSNIQTRITGQTYEWDSNYYIC